MPAAAVTRKQATSRALAALGSAQAHRAVVVYGSVKALRAGARVTQAGASKAVFTVGRGGAYLYYEDGAPSRAYPHRGRVALVNAKSGKARVSGTITRRPLVNGARARLKAVFVGDPFAPPTTFVNSSQANHAPKADAQSVVAKQDRPRRITLTGSDPDGDMFTFIITKLPSHGTLSGTPPDVVYTPDPGHLGPDDFSFKVLDDYDAQSNSAKVFIDVRPPGLAPVVAASAGCTAYTEQSAAVAVDSALTVADPDDTVLAGARVRVASNFERGDDLIFTDQNGISSSYDDITGELLLTGNASVATYQAALRTVRYRNLSSGSPAATKGIAFTADDGGNESAPATKQVCITDTGGSSKPVVGTSEGALNYTEDDGPVPVDGGLFITDNDSANLTGATVKFAASLDPEDDDLGGGGGGSTSTFVPTEDVLAFTDQNGITGSWDGVNGVLTLSGTSSVANYETALRSVTYENTSQNPSDAPRALRIQVTDSSSLNSTPVGRGVLVTPVNDAPVVTPSEGSTGYTEGDPATTIDSDLTVGDVDDTQIEGGQVRISDGFESGDDLIYVDQLGISGVYNTGTGVLTLSGTASVADYQTALRSIQFRGLSDDPPTSKTVEFVVNDGDLDSNPSTKDIAVTPVNDKPVLDSSDTALAYAEDDGAVAIDDGITVADVDSDNLVGATVQITGNADLGEDALAFSDQNGISGTYDSETGTLILSGTASLADYESALRSVTYENTSDDPSTATRTISFQVDDGGSTDNLSDPVSRDVTITASNDAPEVTTSGGSTEYTAGDTAGTEVDAAVAVSDPDDANIEGAQVRIASGFDAGDDLVYVDQLGISGVYNTGTGVLTLTGTASVSDYETALRSIKFRTTAESPAASKTVEFTVNDGDADSAAASKSIDVVQPSSDVAPVVTTSDGSTSYGTGDPAVAIDPGLTVTDDDDTDLESATVRIASAGFDATDVLHFEDQNGISGTYDLENGVLSLGGSASLADYQAALRSITFSTNGSSGTTRSIEFTVNDGELDSSVATKSIDVGPPTF